MSVAVCYFSLLRTFKKNYHSHVDNILEELTKNNITYDIFLHSWTTKNDYQYVWEDIINKKQDYEIPEVIDNKIISKKFESQDEFLSTIDFSKYFYENQRRIEWLPQLIWNHLCALESMKRVLKMVKESSKEYDYIMLVRPDVQIINKLPINEIHNFLSKQQNGICIPKYDSYEGYNDRFAIMNINNAEKYFERIDEIAEFRKNYGRIVSEKYTKYIVDKYYELKLIDFKFKIIRP